LGSAAAVQSGSARNWFVLPLLLAIYAGRLATEDRIRNLIGWIEMTPQDPIVKARPDSGKDSDLPYRAAASRRSTGRTQDIDHHVGARVRERRIMLGLTQQQLADLIGVTYQQAHKYERGINRVSAGRL
jgi:DNA-binding XRE family transcriptional regulator